MASAATTAALSPADTSSPGPGTSPASRKIARPRPRAKPTACGRCHARKVKCSGSQPCEPCRQAGKESDCSYPRRNRMVKVSQRYLDDILAENQRLRSQTPSNGSPAAPEPQHCKKDGNKAGDAVCFEHRPWFIEIVPQTPILVCEAADAVFASRFRQALLGGRHHGHIPRINYATDESLFTLSDADCAWPNPYRARLLVDVALSHVSRYYHIVRRSVILEALESETNDLLTRSKLWVLFAIGEMYSCRASRSFPGIRYFARATRVLRIVSERPTISEVELRLLLLYYSLALNRRHAAYTLAGSAVRLAVVMGLHLNVPQSQLKDPVIREHRVRAWWTAYHFDRLCASNLGNPYAIDDGEIQVELPTDRPELANNPAAAVDFADAAYINARIKLTRVSARIVQSIYGRRIQHESLSNRVQQALKDLSAWVEELPAHLHIDAQEAGTSELMPKPISLRLSFNQCVINATRPILLHVLRTHSASWAAVAGATDETQSTEQTQPVPHIVSTIAETCIRCARHSVRLLTEAWVDGSFKTFNFLYTQYLFSAATILAISTLLPPGDSAGDGGDQFETAAGILTQVRDSGAYSGEEFCRHIEAMKAAMDKARQRIAGAAVARDSGVSSAAAAALLPTSVADPTWSRPNDAPTLALLEPSLRDLLSQSTPDLNFIDASTDNDNAYTHDLYWPDPWMSDVWAT